MIKVVMKSEGGVQEVYPQANIGPAPVSYVL